MNEQAIDNKNAAASIITSALALSIGYAIVRYHIAGPCLTQSESLQIVRNHEGDPMVFLDKTPERGEVRLGATVSDHDGARICQAVELGNASS